MADTLPNIPVTSNVWTDVYATTGIPVGTPIIIDNVGAADVYFTEQIPQPSPDHDAYRVIKRRCCEAVGSDVAPGGVWVFTPVGATGKVNVRENVLVAATLALAPARNAGTPFNLELTPIAQAAAQYGLVTELTTTITIGTGADAGANVQGQFFATNGAAGGVSFGSVFSRVAGQYRPGQGFVAMFTAVFDENPSPTSSLRAGVINGTDSLTVARENNIDAARYECCGQQPIWHLEYSAGASGAEAVVVEIDGAGFPVNLTAGTARDAAAQTADQLNGAVPSWRFQQVGDLVVSRGLLSRAEVGAFSFTPDGGGTAAAAFTQVIAGAPTAVVLFPRSTWLNANAVAWLDLSKENQYRIRMQFIGAVFFEVQDPDTGEFVCFHSIPYPNTATRPMFSQPSFRIGWAAVSQASDAAYTIRGSEYGLFMPGVLRSLLAPESANGTEAVLLTVPFAHVLTVKNRETFGNRVNLGILMPEVLTATTDSSKGAEVLIVKNAVFDVDLTFDFQNEFESIALVSTDAAEFVSAERTLENLPVAPDLVPLQFLAGDLLTLILPGESVSVVMRRQTGGAGTAGTASLVWSETI